MKLWVYFLCLPVASPGLASETKENACEREFQAINQEAMAQLSNEKCKQVSFSPELKAWFILEFKSDGVLFDSLLKEGEEEPFKSIDINSYGCASIDDQTGDINIATIISIQMELSKEVMEILEIKEENGCLTQLMTSPKMQIPASSNYEWIDISSIDDEIDETSASGHLVSSNVGLMEKMRERVSTLSSK